MSKNVKMSKYDIINVIVVSSRTRERHQECHGYQIHRTGGTIYVSVPSDLIVSSLLKRLTCKSRLGQCIHCPVQGQIQPDPGLCQDQIQPDPGLCQDQNQPEPGLFHYKVTGPLLRISLQGWIQRRRR